LYIAKQKSEYNMKTTGNIITVGSAQFEHVETGIYRNVTTGTYFERPKVRGKRTWRSLETKNLKHAREELHRRRSGLSEAAVERAKSQMTVGEIIRRYQKDGYPDHYRQQREGRTMESESRNCIVLLKFFDRYFVSEISLPLFDSYHGWRKKHIKRGTGDRSVDMDLNTLSNALLWGMRSNLILQNPMNFRRPRYCSAKTVRHCREFMPHDTEALHEIAAVLFSDIRCETLGWQMTFEAFTGLRTCEALQMRTNAQPYEPGWITADGKSMCVRRAKNQESVNPFVRIHEGLAAWVIAHKEWKQQRYPDSPWFFPNYRDPDGKPADNGALGHALRLRLDKIGRKITSHGMRAFYVTVRRSNGIPDIQIAYEIGHTSAGKTLASVYGGVPPHWLTEDGPKLKWLPESGKPAWEAISSKPAEPQHPAQNSAVPDACPPPVSTICNEACQEPARPATEPNGAQSCPPTTKPSGRPPCVIAKYSYPESPVTLN
jgi:integrase